MVTRKGGERRTDNSAQVREADVALLASIQIAIISEFDVERSYLFRKSNTV